MTRVLVVVERPEDWPLHVPGVELVQARRYLTDIAYSTSRGIKVFNLSRSYRYQSLGYYVSLLASARGHRPLPSVSTIQDLKNPALVRFVSEDLEEQMQRTLAPLTSTAFTLSIYFGHNVSSRYDRLALQLFNLFPAPLLRAEFVVGTEGWEMKSLRPIAAKDIPAHHMDFVVQRAGEYFAGKIGSGGRKPSARYDLAILANPKEEHSPSNERALKKFCTIGASMGFDVQIIDRDDFGRLAEFDALFIRETTAVDHHTYRFARRAAALDLVVIDDADSILRCTNKVFLAELMRRAKVPIPRTTIVHRDNLEEVGRELGFPCILKQPDSSFSKGVVRLDTKEAFEAAAKDFLDESDLLIAQEFLPTDFDWRVGVLDGQILHVCRYHMARGHWQIIHKVEGEHRYGRVDAVPQTAAPRSVIATARRAARLIGDGLYGVDVKQVGRKAYLIEVNDNPSLDAGFEDGILGDELYRRILAVFADRIEMKRRGLE